jgi:BMFP domain-containing protein YqiC
MLTKNDLKAIGELLNSQFDERLKPLDDKFGVMDDRFDAIDERLKPLETEIKIIKAHNIRIEDKLDKIKFKFDKNLTEWKSELFNKIDVVIKRLESAEQENIILGGRGEDVEELNNRVKSLEDIHPEGQHAQI